MTPSDVVPHLQLRWHGRTVVGQVRTNNEDSLCAASLGSEAHGGDSNGTASLDGAGVLLAVADGMGGALAGEIASGLAVNTLAVEMAAHAQSLGTAEPAGDHADALVRSVESANQKIRAQGETNPQQRGMGTTLTAVWAQGNAAYIAQVGDSRAYLFRGGHLLQLTKDQSLVGKLIEDGIITEEEAERIAGRNIILQALGSEEELEVVKQLAELHPSDALMLCTDGLSGVVTNTDIEEMLRRGGSPQAIVDGLIAMAEERGGPDNITVILARVEATD